MSRMQAAAADFVSDIVRIDLNELGTTIADLIADVGQLNVVSAGDLMVFGENDHTPPNTVLGAVKYGTKLFDALLYFSLEGARRPAIQQGVDIGPTLDGHVMLTKKRLLWMAIFLMLRGSYPEATGNAIGADVPAFLRTICGMNESPAQLSAELASFPLSGVNPGWIRVINWTGMASAIRQRLALGLAGYRALGPFKLYPCRADVPADVQDAFEWVRVIATQPPDYAILSATRSAALIGKLGSWNGSLGNLMLLCFTPAQLNEMVANKLLFAMPVRDLRHDTWRSWVAGGPLGLSDPIQL